MFDCHAHLTDPSFAEGLDEALAQAEAVGVTGIITVSESLEDAGQVHCIYCANTYCNVRYLSINPPRRALLYMYDTTVVFSNT